MTGEAIEDLITQMSANTNLALSAYAAGDYRRAQAFQETILRLIPSERVRERFGRALLPAVNALSNLARAQAQRGLFDEASATVRLRSRWPRRPAIRTAWPSRAGTSDAFTRSGAIPPRPSPS